MKTLVIIMLGLLLNACALFQEKKTSMEVSERLPAAEGQLRADGTDNDNTKIELMVKHLATPEKLEPDATTYMVWARPSAGAPAQPLGALKVDDDLNAKLETVTPLKNFELFITAEDSPLVTDPTGEALLWTNINRE
ncbi:MAG TPA: hypothetical protein VFV50_14650 [Bdellovibrionales bacterium]|nr:hypothetical protein [Bdellovibrionales bacterium]